MSTTTRRGTLRDMRHVTSDGTVRLRSEYARDVITPDPDRIAVVYGERHPLNCLCTPCIRVWQ